MTSMAKYHAVVMWSPTYECAEYFVDSTITLTNEGSFVNFIITESYIVPRWLHNIFAGYCYG